MKKGGLMQVSKAIKQLFMEHQPALFYLARIPQMLLQTENLPIFLILNYFLVLMRKGRYNKEMKLLKERRDRTVKNNQLQLVIFCDLIFTLDS